MLPGSYYHVFNRGINKGLIFFEEANYIYFLQQFKKYLSEYVDVFSYCLMPNHFHFFVRIKEIRFNSSNSKLSPIEKGFRDFFISYARSVNKRYNRTGALFQYKFKRKEITHLSYYTWLIYYIHANPVKAGLSLGFEQWKWSSFTALAGDLPTVLQRDEVKSWFGSKEAFILFHKNNWHEKVIQDAFIKQFEP
jgi:REP element-mobilizing transposase RayT